MAYSLQREVSDGSLQYVNITIQYFDKRDLFVYKDGLVVPKTSDEPSAEWSYVWDGDRIKINKVVPIGAEILVRRKTPYAEPMHIYRQGAVFKDSTMDDNFLQMLLINQENAEGLTATDFYNDLDFHGYRLKNVGTAKVGTDAVPYSQYVADALGARQSRIAAAQSAADAAQLFVSSGASLVGYSPSGAGAIATSVQDKLRESTSVKDFGAIGDGVSDDTAAIQAALNSTASEIIFPPGVYRVVDRALNGSPVLTSSVAGRHIRGHGVITATSQVKKLLLVTGDNTTISLNINGNSFIGYAIVVQASNPTVTGCNIINLDGKNNYSGVGIQLDLDGFDTSAVVSNNMIRNLQGVGDGVPGNGIGMQRAITVNSNQNCTKRILITGNRIAKVEGAEGDAIVVISSNGAGIYYDMPVVIENNIVDLWTRRAVKVQANGVSILRNSFSNDRSINPGSLQRAVDIVQGGSSVIDGNVFKCCKFQTQIGVNYSASEAKNNFAVTNNVITGIENETTATLISLNTYGSGVTIAGNAILCPNFTKFAIGATNCVNPVIAANAVVIGSPSWYNFASSTGTRLFGNTLGNGQKNSYSQYYDIDANEFLFDVSNCRSLTLSQLDDTISDGEIVAKLRCRQNDLSAPNAVNASVGFIGEGSAGALAVGIFTGSQANGTADTERVRVTSSGVFRPTGDNTQTLGAAANRWSVVYAGTGTINTSDERDKTDVHELSDVERKIALRIKSLMRSFRFKDSVDSKGDSARIHFGVIAQEVQAAFESEGLDAFAYGILCYDAWEELPEIVDEDGKVVQAYRAAGNRFGVRYDELLCFIIGAI